eukprot:scaffold4847_cov89-Cylindrotheca_fusiformis.AAC.12
MPPPHTMLLSGQEELKEIVRGLIPEIVKAIDDRSMSGNLSESRMRSIVANEMRELRTLIVQQSSALGGAGGTGSNRQTNQQAMDRTGLHKLWMIDGKLRRVPPNWSFPSGPFIDTYQYWHHGDEAEQISPMIYFTKKDVSWNKNQNRWVKNLEEAQHICRKLDKAAKEKNLLSEVPGRIEVINAFYGAKDVFGISDTTPTGRKRNFSKMTLGTIVREARRNAKRTT